MHLANLIGYQASTSVMIKHIRGGLLCKCPDHGCRGHTCWELPWGVIDSQLFASGRMLPFAMTLDVCSAYLKRGCPSVTVDYGSVSLLRLLLLSIPMRNGVRRSGNLSYLSLDL